MIPQKERLFGVGAVLREGLGRRTGPHGLEYPQWHTLYGGERDGYDRSVAKKEAGERLSREGNRLFCAGRYRLEYSHLSDLRLYHGGGLRGMDEEETANLAIILWRSWGYRGSFRYPRRGSG